MKIYKRKGKTWSNPADDLRDTFSKKELDFLNDYNHKSPLYKLEANRDNYLWAWHTDHSSICKSQDWIEFPRIDDFLVTMYKMLNGSGPGKLNLNDKDHKFFTKLVDKIASIRYRNILANKPEYESFLGSEWIG